MEFVDSVVKVIPSWWKACTSVHNRQLTQKSLG